MMRSEAEIRERLAQHEQNRKRLKAGEIEPDPDVREMMVIGFDSAIRMLQWVLGERE